MRTKIVHAVSTAILTTSMLAGPAFAEASTALLFWSPPKLKESSKTDELRELKELKEAEKKFVLPADKDGEIVPPLER